MTCVALVIFFWCSNKCHLACVSPLSAPLRPISTEAIRPYTERGANFRRWPVTYRTQKVSHHLHSYHIVNEINLLQNTDCPKPVDKTPVHKLNKQIQYKLQIALTRLSLDWIGDEVLGQYIAPTWTNSEQ